ncbi:hypothetical protein DRJ19_01020, partial [Candidatus Woesearchaeota archaeon]
MNNHDTKYSIKDILKQISPEFQELTADVQQIMELSKNPVMIGVLLYKLAEERRRTNELLMQLNEKYDKIMFKLKTEPQSKNDKQTVELLPEPDRKIMQLAKINGYVDAETVMKALGYKGLNAASQRLNRLAKDGFLQKVRSGRKVLYFLHTP